MIEKSNLRDGNRAARPRPVVIDITAIDAIGVVSLHQTITALA